MEDWTFRKIVSESIWRRWIRKKKKRCQKGGKAINVEIWGKINPEKRKSKYTDPKKEHVWHVPQIGKKAIGSS